MGETGFLSTSAGFMADVLVGAGRTAEAEEMVELCERSAGPDDFSSQALWRRVRARLLVHAGDVERAERLAREDVALVDPTDYTIERAEARRGLADVLAAAGRVGEALGELRQAVVLYGDKGATVLEERARMRLAELEAASPG
jgi:ATP/maltotriose-dependent transcriptional regulator MalT